MLSIVIPYFENPDQLSVTLRGILDTKQDVDLEVIVVNDGGEIKPLPEVLERFYMLRPVMLTLDPPTTEFRAGMARNMGALRSCGSRILFLDADCVPRGPTLARHAEYANSNAVIAGAINIVEYAEPLSVDILIADRKISSESLDRRYRLYKDTAAKLKQSRVFETHDHKPFWSGHLSVPARQFKELGGFWEEIQGYGSEDQELAWRMYESGCRLVIDFTCFVQHIGPQRVQQWAAHREGVLLRSQREPSLVRKGRFLPNLVTAPK